MLIVKNRNLNFTHTGIHLSLMRENIIYNIYHYQNNLQKWQLRIYRNIRFQDVKTGDFKICSFHFNIDVYLRTNGRAIKSFKLLTYLVSLNLIY